jgi:hypothetical protein
MIYKHALERGCFEEALSNHERYEEEHAYVFEALQARRRFFLEVPDARIRYA